jgi:hypothetical protein
MNVLCTEMPESSMGHENWNIGYVYLASGHPLGYTKIGRTIRIYERFRGTGEYGFRVSLLWAAHVPGMCGVERFLHLQFQGLQRGKLREEWFDLQGKDTALIKRTLMQWATHIVYPLHGKLRYAWREK